MNYYMIVEPMIKNAYWCNRYTDGIKDEIKRSKGSFVEIVFDEADLLLKYAKKQNLRPVVIVNCISRRWIAECVMKLQQLGIHPLLIAPFKPVPPMPVSTVSFDFDNAFYGLCQYLFNGGRKRVALFGVNPNSSNDMAKKHAFLLFLKNYGLKDGERKIFWNKGSLEQCCRSFHASVADFDAVVCANDVIAVKMISYFKKHHIRIPEDLYVAAMGNTVLSRFITPDITICELNCEQIGRQAVKTSTMLAKNPDISFLNVTVAGTISPRKSTDFAPVSANLPPGQNVISEENINFYSDDDVSRIFRMERLVSSCDELDLNILYGLMCGKRIINLAEELFSTENTIKYRIKKMQNLTNTCSRDELTRLFSDFLY
jgi:DNA-binding LacI/PurR family transcriptional regulator